MIKKNHRQRTNIHLLRIQNYLKKIEKIEMSQNALNLSNKMVGENLEILDYKMYKNVVHHSWRNFELSNFTV